MNWEECVEEAKEELGIDGWTEDWEEVMDLAKEKYWSRETFKELKEETLSDAKGKCKLCNEINRLTAHHIFYGGNEEAICLCKRCHGLVHQSKWGFVLQLALKHINSNFTYPIPPNLQRTCNSCIKELFNKIGEPKDG